jgi:very-short-patch-repair endonuclease
MKVGGPQPGNEGERSRGWRVTCTMCKEAANSERMIARIAANQHGVVAASQLRRAGLRDYTITRRVRAGRLHRLHRGVYAVGHTNLSFEGRCMAAALALGETAYVSHRSAAAVWGLLKPHSGPVELTVLGDAGRRKRPGISIHRSQTLTARLITRRHGIAVTKPSRTLRDLRRTVPRPVFRAAVRRALDLRLIRSAGIPEADLTRSQFERAFLALCRRHRLPQPEVNSRLGPYEVDFLWRDRGLVVEVDGFRHHGGRAAFESDRARDARLQSLGYRVLRFTYRQLRGKPSEVVSALRALLGPIPLFG